LALKRRPREFDAARGADGALVESVKPARANSTSVAADATS